MLVLSRRKGERIRIGPTMEVAVLAIRGNTVKLGFSGPADVAIQREEVYQRIEANKVQSCRRRPVPETVCG